MNEDEMNIGSEQEYVAEAEEQTADPEVPPVYDEPEEPVKKKSKLKLVLGLAGGVVVLGAIAFLVISILGNKPMKLLNTAVQKTSEAAATGSLTSSAEKTAKSGSVGISVDLSKWEELIGEKIDAQIDATYFSSFDKSKAAGALQLAAKYNRKALLDATLVVSNDYIAVKCEEILGKNSYGIKIGDMYKNLKGSIFDPDKDTYYALPEEAYEYLVNNGKDLQKNLTGYADKTEDLAKSLKEEFLKSVEKNVEIEKSSEKIEVGKSEVKTTCLTFTIDEEALAKLAADLVSWAKSSKDLKSLLTSVVKDNAEMLDELGMDADEAVETLYDLIDEAAEMLKKPEDFAEMLEEELGGFEITVAVYVNKSNKQIVTLDVSAKLAKEKLSANFVMGPDLSKPEVLSLTLKLPNGSKDSAEYLVDENSSSDYSASFKLKGGKETLCEGSLKWNKKDGDFTLKFVDDSDAEISLTGNLTKKSKVTTIVLKKFSVDSRYDSVAIKDLGTTITINESAKMPSVSKYTDILTMKESAFEDLLEDIMDNAEDLMDKIDY